MQFVRISKFKVSILNEIYEYLALQIEFRFMKWDLGYIAFTLFYFFANFLTQSI
jgi:hypothetical protein